MSSVDAISTKGLGYGAVSAVDSDKESDAAVSFSAIMNQLRSSAGGSSSGTSDSTDATETITRIMPDGSLMVTVYQGSEIISQKKMSPDEVVQPESSTTKDGVVDSTAQTIASSSAATLLNALTQS